MNRKTEDRRPKTEDRRPKTEDRNYLGLYNNLIKRNKGFTLIEVILVLSIAMILGFLSFSQMLKKVEFDRAGIAGKQIKLIGEATNAYISNHYDVLLP